MRTTKSLILASFLISAMSFVATRAAADPLDNWQVQQLSTDILTGVAYGNSTYVIVGQTNGKIYTSTDASTWIDRTYDTSSHSYGITFANGVFAAAGVYNYFGNYYGGVQSSTDGINWTTTGVDSCSNFFDGITFTNNKFFAVGQGGGLQTSPDGYAWPNSCNNYGGEPDIEGVAYGSATYVVVTKNGHSGFFASGSDNLWSSSTPPTEGLPIPINSGAGYFRDTGTTSDLLGVAYGNATFVAVGTAGTIITSSDGITWTSRTSGTTNTLYAVTFADSVFAAAGDGGTILTSSDGIAWTSRVSGTTNLLRGIAFTNDRFIAIGVDGTITMSGAASPAPTPTPTPALGSLDNWQVQQLS